MPRIILFNKPYGVLSQFTGANIDQTLAAYVKLKNFYAAGRLDRDSEGLLLLTDDGKLQQAIANPIYKQGKTYLAQLEGRIDEQALCHLRNGVSLKDGQSKLAEVAAIDEPTLWERLPAIRHRLTQSTSWIELTLYEGRNRQVRRMTAAVGFPTLRLVRTRIAEWHLGDLHPGQSRLLQLD